MFGLAMRGSLIGSVSCTLSVSIDKELAKDRLKSDYLIINALNKRALQIKLQSDNHNNNLITSEVYLK